MSAGPPPLTTHRRLAPGTVLRRGASAPYRAVELIGGEPHLRRDDLSVPAGAATSPPGARPLLCLIHVTDLQLADVQSPTRFEFLNRYFADPRYAGLVPVQRPQEALTPHAVDATLRTVNALRGPATGQPPALAVTTGDAIDNAQWNEVQAFLALFDGGQVTPDSGGPGYAGVQAPDWPDDIFWRPDGDGPDGPDFFRRELGFPHHPGLLEAAMRAFTAGGLAMPWLSCFGNHEALNQGVGTQTPGLAAALTGGWKPTALPGGFDSDVALELFTVCPEAFMAGPSRAVPADPRRRPVTRREFVAAHFRPGARPLGHGFTDENLRDGTAYYVHDTPAARFIALDTNCLAGGADGCLDRQQARWLADRLAEVHSAYRGPAGDEIRTGRDDRLVILFSHHGADTLTNTRGWHPGPGRRAPDRRGRTGGPAAPLPQRRAVAERAHAHERGPPAPRPGPTGAGVLGGHHLRGGGLAVPDTPRRTGRPRRPAVHHLHDGGSRRAAGAPDASQPVPGHGSAIQHGRPGRAAP